MMGKKKYVLGFVIFIVLVFAFDRGLFVLIRSVEAGVHKKKSLRRIFFQKRDFNKQFLDLPKGTYNTLIMGSSRTHRGIHPYYIYKRLKQKAFKIARAKIRIKFNYYFYKEYKKIAGVPRVVIYGLDYFMFKLEAHDFFMDALSGEGVETAPYSDGPLLLLANKPRIDSLIDHLLEGFDKELSAGQAAGQPFKVIDPFTGYEKQASQKLARKKRARFKKFKYFPYPGKEGIYFTRLLDEWKKDGVQVVLVFLPDYIGTYESNFQVDLFRKDIEKITAPYDNVSIYDYSRPDRFRLSKRAYFLDGGYGKSNSHLSKAGARVFNRKLAGDLKKHYRQ
jgi:hypothetical protein